MSQDLGERDVFHAGERLAQRKAGFVVKGAPIRDAMTEQHRVFFVQLPLLFAAVPDRAGWPVATVLEGAPGFVSSPDAVTLRVGVRPGEDDPAAAGLAVGAEIGLLGLEFATRRRNRANGVVSAVMSAAFFVDVRQSFGNCPQYIQTREMWGGDGKEPGAAEVLAGLDGAAQGAIEGADTFFVASRSGAEAGGAGGVDMSHRGGRPGFVRVDGDVLMVPDFRGNRYFNTLGNFLEDQRAGLLFADFATGDLLQVQGRVEIDWAADGPAGTERVWRVNVVSAVRRPGALRTRFALDGYSPHLARTGVWGSGVWSS